MSDALRNACGHDAGFDFDADGIGLACNRCGMDSHDVEAQQAALAALRDLAGPDPEAVGS